MKMKRRNLCRLFFTFLTSLLTWPLGWCTVAGDSCLVSVFSSLLICILRVLLIVFLDRLLSMTPFNRMTMMSEIRVRVTRLLTLFFPRNAMIIVVIVFVLIIVKFDDEPDSTPTGDWSCYFYPQNTELCVSLESEMRKEVMTALSSVTFEAKTDLSNKQQN